MVQFGADPLPLCQPASHLLENIPSRRQFKPHSSPSFLSLQFERLNLLFSRASPSLGLFQSVNFPFSPILSDPYTTSRVNFRPFFFYSRLSHNMKKWNLNETVTENDDTTRFGKSLSLGTPMSTPGVRKRKTEKLRSLGYKTSDMIQSNFVEFALTSKWRGER